MELAPGKLPNSAKSEHLIDGIKPIMVCLYSYGDLTPLDGMSDVNELAEAIEGAHNVNFWDKTEELKKKNFLNSKQHAYIISSIDGIDKFSTGFKDCTGLIVVGVDKITGKNISFITHQNPYRFLISEKDRIPGSAGVLSGEKENFVNHLKKSLEEIKSRCRPGTIDAVFIGGKYPLSSHRSVPIFQKEYLESIKLVSNEVQKILGFEPVVVNGPKTTEGEDNVYFENKERRVYLSRPKVNTNINSFTQSGPRGKNP